MGGAQSQESKMAEDKPEAQPAEEAPEPEEVDVDQEKEEGEKEEAEVPGDDDVKSSKLASLTSFVKAEGRPVQWILDRCNGHERVMNPNSKPCCCALYPNGFLKLFPGLFESNPFMEWFGRVGCVPPTAFRTRRAIFLIVMIFSSIGWICMLLADMSMSKDYNVLRKFGFSDGDVKFAFADDEFNIVEGKTKIHVGVRAVAWTRSVANVSLAEIIALQDIVDIDAYVADNTVTERFVTGFDEFCDGDSRVFFVNPSQCNACEDASTKMVRGLIMPTVFYFFTFKNDWLRFWPNYDVNCQKVMSFFVGSITIALALRTFFKYRNDCFNSFREGEFCFYSNSTIAKECPRIYNDEAEQPENATEEEFFEQVQKATDISWSKIKWDAGNGFILLGTAVFVRLFSMLSNLTVPTPSITRDRDEQWEYERLAKQQEAAKSEYFLPW